MPEKADNERGKLRVQLGNFGQDPEPHVWSSIEERLAKKRKKRPFYWWLAASVFLVFGTWSLLWHFAKKAEVPVNQADVVSNQSKRQSAAPKTRKHSGTPSTQPLPEQTGAQSLQSEPGKLNPASSLNPSGSGTEQLVENQQRMGDAERKSLKAERLPKFSRSTDLAKIQGNMGEKELKKSTVLTTSSREHATPSKRRKWPIEYLSHEKEKQLASAQPSGQVRPTFNGKQSDGRQEIQKDQIFEEKVSSEYARRQTTQAESEGVNQTKTYSELPKDSSLPKQEDASGLVRKDSSNQARAYKSRFEYEVFGALKIAAFRQLAINQNQPEHYLILNARPTPFSQRLAFDIGQRFRYLFSQRTSFVGLLGLTHMRESLQGRQEFSTITGYDLTVEGEFLKIIPIRQTDLVGWQSQQWAGFLGLGLGYSFSSAWQLEACILGQWRLYERQGLNLGSSMAWKQWGPSMADPNVSLRMSLNRRVNLGNKELVFSPFGQWFQRPQFRFQSESWTQPFYLGLQAGMKW